MRIACLLMPALLAAAEPWSVPVSPPPGASATATAVVRVWPTATGALAVLGPDGRALPSRTLWSAPGEPADILFAPPPGGGAVRVAAAAAEPAPWTPKAGVVLEVRRRAPGDPDDRGRMEAMWKASEPQGRVLVERVFQGVNPAGPTRDNAAEFRGWLRIDRPGKWRLATISSDASLVDCDGRPVCAWPGWHGIDGGKRAQHGGEIELAAGLHELRYLLVARGDILMAVLAWTPPGADKPEPVPASAFVQPVRWQAQAADQPWIAWEMAGHATAGPATLIAAELRAVLPSPADLRWDFGDGSTAEVPAAASGRPLRHSFAGAGMRRVRLLVAGRGEGERRIAVHPRWDQMEEASQEELEKPLRAADVQKLALADLRELGRWVLAREDRSWIMALAGAVQQRAVRLEAPVLDLALDLGLELQRPPSPAYGRSAELLAAAALGPPCPRAARAGLHLAGFLVHVQGQAPEAVARLAALPAEHLAGDERRLAILYRGDARLAAGEIEAARAAYAEAGDAVRPDDAGYALRRRLRLEQAKDLLAAHDPDGAERLLREIEWETPRERMGHETGLQMARAQLARGEVQPALVRIRRLLPSPEAAGGRADLLLAGARAAISLGRRAEADEMLAALRRDHPWSTAAAQAGELGK